MIAGEMSSIKTVSDDQSAYAAARVLVDPAIHDLERAVPHPV
jgi:hypothetical protein